MILLDGEPEAGPWRSVDLEEVLGILRPESRSVRGRPVVVAVDGRSSSGKTSLAARLAAAVPHSAVVHTDDIAWHHAAFGWTQALVDGVLTPVRRGEAVRYRPPGWVARGRPGAVEVSSGLDLLLVEGDGSSRRELTRWLDASLYVQADERVRRDREASRVAAGEMSPEDHASWVAEEEPFVLADRPWERAALVVCGSPDVLPSPPAPGHLAVSAPSPA